MTALVVTAVVAVEPRQEPAVVASSVQSALVDPDGALAPRDRALGQALDRSDVFAALHGVTGLVGVKSLDVPGTGEVGRRGAAWYELLVLDSGSTVAGEST